IQSPRGGAASTAQPPPALRSRGISDTRAAEIAPSISVPFVSAPPTAERRVDSGIRGRVGDSLRRSLARHLPPSETELALALLRTEIDPARLGANAAFTLQYVPSPATPPPVPAVNALRESIAPPTAAQGESAPPLQHRHDIGTRKSEAAGRRLVALRVEDGGAVYEFRSLRPLAAGDRLFVNRRGQPVRSAGMGQR
ncbi:MAG: hypothetical protein ACR2RL_01370, partial [Gammaproteobacteria bacterium]